MKAIVYREYGPPNVFHIEEVEKPKPNKNEILIKIKATAVNSADCRLRRADPFFVRFFFGFWKPKKSILGVVVSGEVEKTGADVKLFKEGDAVFGLTDMTLGGYAEYICLPEIASIALKPPNITHAEAATIPFGAHTALYFLRNANIRPGQNILIYGASGAVGSAAVQLARYFGAEVTGVCSAQNIELVKSLGASFVIDYSELDFSKMDKLYDVIFETVNKAPVSKIFSRVKKNGIVILGAAMIKEALLGLWHSVTQKKKLLIGEAKANAEDMNFLKGLLGSGQLRAVIDRIYTLEQMSEAHEYVDQGHKKGNVAITIKTEKQIDNSNASF